MNSAQKIINILTMCRRANMLVMGFDAVKEAAVKGDISCVVITNDISPKTLKEVRFFCSGCKMNIVELDIDSDEIYYCLGKKFVVMGIASHGFAQKLKTLQRAPESKSQQG